MLCQHSRKNALRLSTSQPPTKVWGRTAWKFSAITRRWRIRGNTEQTRRPLQRLAIDLEGLFGDNGDGAGLGDAGPQMVAS